jgi:hypothetical protein
VSGGPPLWLLLSCYQLSGHGQPGEILQQKAKFFASKAKHVITNEDTQRLQMGTLHESSLSPLLVARLTILSKVRTAMPVGPFDRNGLASSAQAVPAISR